MKEAWVTSEGEAIREGGRRKGQPWAVPRWTGAASGQTQPYCMGRWLASTGNERTKPQRQKMPGSDWAFKGAFLP